MSPAPREVAPVYRVLQEGLAPAYAERVAKTLKVEESTFSIPYVGPFYPGPKPFVGSGGGLDAEVRRLMEAAPPGIDEAIDLSVRALDQLKPGAGKEGPITWTPRGSQTYLEIAGLGSTSTSPPLQIPISTQVDFDLSLDDIPLVGPGAKVKFSWRADAKLDLLLLEVPDLEEIASLKLISPAYAREMFSATLGLNEKSDSMELDLVYFLKKAESHLQRLLSPSYRVQAPVPGDGNEDGIDRLKTAYASVTTLERPVVEINLKRITGGVHAIARVEYGKLPYTYSWHSSALRPGTANTQAITLEFPGNQQRSEEKLDVIVTDSNGRASSARVSLGGVGSPLMTKDDSIPVAAIWSGDVPIAGDEPDYIGVNAHDFAATFREGGHPIAFNRGDESAHERHFVDPDQRRDGQDSSYVDSVPLVFFSGHGGPRGFRFSTRKKDRRLDYTARPRWGNKELAWLALDSCLVLEPRHSDFGHFGERWGQAFAGLHLMLGYSTLGGNVPGLGAAFARKLLSGETLATAWAVASLETQESETRWALMGVIDKSGLAHLNDRLKDSEPTGDAAYDGPPLGHWLLHGSS